MFAQRLGELRGAIVVVDILQRARNTLALDDVERQVAVAGIDIPVRLGMIDRERCLDALERGFGVKPAEALEGGVGDDRHRVVGDHAVVFLAPQGPDRHIALRLLVRDHGFDKAVHALGSENGVERMRRAVGVPERERGVVRLARRGQHLVVCSAILPVHIRDVVRLDEKVVHGGIEILFLLARPFDLGAGEQGVPRGLGLRAHLHEVPVRDLGGQVLFGAFHADG